MFHLGRLPLHLINCWQSGPNFWKFLNAAIKMLELAVQGQVLHGYRGKGYMEAGRGLLEDTKARATWIQ